MTQTPVNGEHVSTPASVPLHRRDSLASTQDEAAALLAAGARAPCAVATLDQRGGRGRLGRSWIAPRGAGLALTVALRPDLPVTSRSWIPLAVGLAALEAIRELDPRDPAALGLKWPNDLLVLDSPEDQGRKLGGILVEGRGADVVLVGIGVNLLGPVRDASGMELPAAWLRGPGGILPGDALADDGAAWHLASVLAERIVRVVGRIESSGGDADAAGLHEDYRMSCVTLGRDVRILPLGTDRRRDEGPGAEVRGRAVGIGEDGALIVDTGGGTTLAVGAGDVLHAGIDPTPPGPCGPTIDPTQDAGAHS